MLLQQAFGWLHVFVAAGGAVVSGLNLGRSRWASLLMGGFIAEATVTAYYQVVMFLIQNRTVGVAALGAASALASLVGLGARICVVRGVAGVLSDAGRPVGDGAGARAEG